MKKIILLFCISCTICVACVFSPEKKKDDTKEQGAIAVPSTTTATEPPTSDGIRVDTSSKPINTTPIPAKMVDHPATLEHMQVISGSANIDSMVVH